jgi:hypothetical protein
MSAAVKFGLIRGAGLVGLEGKSRPISLPIEKRYWPILLSLELELRLHAGVNMYS